MEKVMIKMLESVKFDNLDNKINYILKNFVTPTKSYLNHIPENCKTYSLYSKALEINPQVINQVPDKFINSDLLETVLRSHPATITNLPQKWKKIDLNVDLYYDLLSYNPLYLEFIPNAVKLNGQAFEFVPTNLQTQDMLTLALSKCKEYDNDNVQSKTCSNEQNSPLVDLLNLTTNVFTNCPFKISQTSPSTDFPHMFEILKPYMDNASSIFNQK